MKLAALALALAAPALAAPAAPTDPPTVAPSTAPKSALGEDLSKVYPATLEWSANGLFPVCDAEDVWRLASFDLEFDGLEISCGKAQVALAHDGTNVLWAVVFPDEPAKVASEVGGKRERTAAIFLRFAPGEVEQIFPSRTVKGRGDGFLRAEASRVARAKIGWKWSTPAGNPTVVPRGVTLVDLDVDGGPRRLWCVDRNEHRLEYVADFESQPVPPSPPISKKDAGDLLDRAWEAFDAEYAGFVSLPDLDWDDVRKEYRALVPRAGTEYLAAALVSDMLARLEDLHVWVKQGEQFLPGYTRERPLNGNWNGTRATVGSTTQRGKELHTARTEDGIGYLCVAGLSDADLPALFDAELDALLDTKGLVLDLRFNGGGDETLAQRMAGRFVTEEVVYSKNRYRSGKRHDDLGPIYDRVVGPRDEPRYEAPVVVLQGRRTMSSAESFALMLAQAPNVVTMGDPTAGSSGNPRRLELEHGVVVNLPRWLDMDPDGNPIERIGVAPDVVLEFAPEAFTEKADPVVAAALERLRADAK
ncbi:MAG: S41 family peptidase [Planctomycetota bacterium]